MLQLAWDLGPFFTTLMNSIEYKCLIKDDTTKCLIKDDATKWMVLCEGMV